MTNGDDEELGNPVADRRGAWTGKRRKGLRVASAAGLALGLAVGGSAIAGATTSGSSGAHATSPGQPPAGGMPPNGGSPPAAVGTVATVGTNSFALKAKDGSTVTVDVTSSTTYRDRDVTSPTLANVTVGETVAAFGTKTASTVAATSVDIGGPGGPGGAGGHGGSPPAAVGTVATVGTNSFTLKARDGSTVTVDVTSSTTYRDQGVTSPTLANVTVGETVAAFGTDTSNTVSATSVDIGGPGGPGGADGHRGPGGQWGPGGSGGLPPAA
jgi:endonuclease YncB( thermonuclease family)